MIYGSFTPPGFDEDRYDEADRAPLTPEQVAVMNEVWPQYAKPNTARVGVHENDPARPLGTMATADLRKWRQKAHAAVAPIWENGWMHRKKVYQRLSDALGYEIHIGESDAEQCQAIIDTAERLLVELESDPYEKNSWADGHPMDYGNK